MTDTCSLEYFLFPHMTLSSIRLKDLCVFLPRLNVLEIVGRAHVPEWARDRLFGYAAINDDELSSRISSALQGYRDFARVHGGPGGVLGYLRQALDQIDEPRYRIQEELRGKIPQPKDAEQKEILQASLFLEMARELDEKELELQEGYDRVHAIEQEFRDILGLEDEGPEQVEAHLSPALAPDENGLLYMLARRIQSWFRILSLRPLSSMPVFVAGFPEVAQETLESIRSGCERSGKEFSTAVYSLGPVPWSVGSALPDAPELVSSCWLELGDFIRSAARAEGPEKLEDRRRSLQSAFEELCGSCGLTRDATAALRLTVVEKLPLAAAPGLPPLHLAGDLEDLPPAILSVEPRRKDSR